MPRAALTCFIILALAGCGFTTPVGVPTGTTQAAVVFDVVSVINTKKTLDDHVVGWVLDQDCSTIRASRGEAYCQEIPQPVPVVRRVTYCYKSLANITCYDRPLEQDRTRLYGSHTEDIPINRND